LSFHSFIKIVSKQLLAKNSLCDNNLSFSSSFLPLYFVKTQEEIIHTEGKIEKSYV